MPTPIQICIYTSMGCKYIKGIAYRTSAVTQSEAIIPIKDPKFVMSKGRFQQRKLGGRLRCCCVLTLVHMMTYIYIWHFYNAAQD